MKETTARFVPADRTGMSRDIIKVSSMMFLKDGITVVKMDDIARRMSISKRTLYELFPSKERLVLECAISFHRMVHDVMEADASMNMDVISITLHHFSFLISISRKYNISRIAEDLAKYPLIKSFMIARGEKVRTEIRSFIEKGVSQGLFRSEINMDIVMQIVESLGNYMALSDSSRRFTLEEYVNSMILVVLRGIATDKGLETIDRQKDIFNNDRKNDEKIF